MSDMSVSEENGQNFIEIPLEKFSEYTLVNFADNHQAQTYYNKHRCDTVEHAFAIANILHLHKLVREAAYFYGVAFNLHSKRPDEYPLAESLLQARLLCLLKAGQELAVEELDQLKRLSEPFFNYISGIAMAWRQNDPQAAIQRMGNCYESFHTGEEVDVLYLEIVMGLAARHPVTAQAEPERRIPNTVYMYWDNNPPEEVVQNYEYHRSLPDLSVKMFNQEEAAEWIYRFYGLEARDLFLKARHPAEAADFFRVHAIQELGGWWLDADIRIKSQKAFMREAGLNPSHLFFVTENRYVHNDFFGSQRNSPILGDCLLSIYRNSFLHPHLYIAYKTGPGVFNRALNRKFSVALGAGGRLDPTVTILNNHAFDSIIEDMDMSYKKGGGWHNS